MATFSLLPIFSTFLLSLAFLIEARHTLFHQGGFTLDLIHRDSPLSPLYNPSNTRRDIITNAFHRSISRTSSKKPSLSAIDIQSQIYSIPGEYIMKISIGNPPVETLGVADTGSDLTWFQCNPCTNCYNQTTPIFNPNSSSTYKPLSCQSNECSAMGAYSSCSNQKECQYSMSYGDQSYSNGDLSSETLTFASGSKSISIQNVAFGCGHDNSGTFNETISGIIGLGGGPLSIVNQLKDYVNGRFSYCLVPIFEGSNVTSHINFGSQAFVLGPGVVSTPLVSNPKYPDTFYYLTLESVKIGNKSLSYKAYSNSKNRDKKDVVEGNIIIDSGTTLTMLPRDFYNSLESELKKAIGAETTTDPQGLFSLCYKATSNLNAPTITISFIGADLDLPPTSTFLEVEEGLVCLTLIPTDDLAIFGNLSQENFMVGYDLVKREISFKPTDCSKY